MARLSCRFPPRGACSPWIEVPEDLVVGARPHVGGEVGGAGEVGAVADGGQQDGGGPDADAGHRGQDLGKRVGLQQGVDLGFQGPALFVDG